MGRDDDRASGADAPIDGDELTVSSGDLESASDDLTLDGQAESQILKAGARQPESIAGYRILDVLGEGRMGVVWEAEQEHPKRRVALKVIRRDHVVDEFHRRLFHREAESELAQAFPILQPTYGDDHKRTQDAARQLIEIFNALGRGADAAMYRALLAESGDQS